MPDKICECKDNKVYYVLAGGGLVLLTYYLTKNGTQTQEQPPKYLQPHQPINNIYLPQEQLRQISREEKIQEQSKPNRLTVQDMNDKEQNKNTTNEV